MSGKLGVNTVEAFLKNNFDGGLTCTFSQLNQDPDIWPPIDPTRIFAFYCGKSPLWTWILIVTGSFTFSHSMAASAFMSWTLLSSDVAEQDTFGGVAWDFASASSNGALAVAQEMSFVCNEAGLCSLQKSKQDDRPHLEFR